MKNKDPPINIIPGPSGFAKPSGSDVAVRFLWLSLYFDCFFKRMKSKLAIFKTSFINKTSLKIKLRFFSLLIFLARVTDQTNAS